MSPTEWSIDQEPPDPWDERGPAVLFTFDFDADELWRAKIAGDERWDNPSVRNRGKYGAETAVPRILELFERHDRSCTFFVPGRVAEDWPEAVQAIHEAGHEIGHHGYTHVNPASMDQEREEEEFARALDVFDDLIGDTPDGYRCPAGDMSELTLELPAEHGFDYDSSFKYREMPYRRENGLIEIPNDRAINDWPQWGFNYSPTLPYQSGITPNGPVFDSWNEEFEESFRRERLFVVTLHPQLIGMPGRMKRLEELLERAIEAGAWVTTCREVADHWQDVV
jgi:peptidoglycan/xylan/chitin deacetylase (PgdA/CDA1 family)